MFETAGGMLVPTAYTESGTGSDPSISFAVTSGVLLPTEYKINKRT